MRICHGLDGDALEVEDGELAWRKPLDIVRQSARSRWGVSPEDLILLITGGGTVGPQSGAEVLRPGTDVFFFPKGLLDSEAELESDALLPGRGTEEGPNELCFEQFPEVDPAFEAFRANIAEARRRIAEARTVATLATHTEERVAIQRLAARAVLDNLCTHRATCSRSMTLFVRKFERVQERFDCNLGKVDSAIAALTAVSLHPALRTTGRESLVDAVPQERILRFTASLQEERARLNQRLERLRHQDSQVQALCDQVVEKVRHFMQDDAVLAASRALRAHQDKAQHELLPSLQAQVPRPGAPPLFVLEEEKRSDAMLESLISTCQLVHSSLANLQVAWDAQRRRLLQRLREVAYTQSKVRSVERQAALLEEEVNVQRNGSQQLSRLQRMPKAYSKALSEVARRAQFRARYLAQGEQARIALARLVEEENNRRRVFLQHFGTHLPADLIPGLGDLVPPPVVELPDFDLQLPVLRPEDPEAIEEEGAAAPAASSTAPSFSATEQPTTARLEASQDLARGSEPDAAVDSREEPQEPLAATSADTVATATASSAELEARASALEQELAKLREELARLQTGASSMEEKEPPAQVGGGATDSHQEEEARSADEE